MALLLIVSILSFPRDRVDIKLCFSYQLAAFISHMGTSSHSGHYVCHIKDSQGRWIIYNDNKVALSVTPPKELGYLYLYKRCGL